MLGLPCSYALRHHTDDRFGSARRLSVEVWVPVDELKTATVLGLKTAVLRCAGYSIHFIAVPAVAVSR